MKTMKRALAMLMAAFIIAGIFAPVSPQAATKPTVSFYGWAKEDQSQCYGDGYQDGDLDQLHSGSAS